MTRVVVFPKFGISLNVPQGISAYDYFVEVYGLPPYNKNDVWIQLKNPDNVLLKPKHDVVEHGCSGRL